MKIRKSIGFIGGGNMAGAIIGGMIGAGLAAPEQIKAADISDEALVKLADSYGIHVTKDNKKTAAESDILFFAVKPFILPGVMKEIRDVISGDTLIVSIVAGQKIETIEHGILHPVKLIRVMPNTPALVGAGMSALAPNSEMQKGMYADELEEVKSIFSSFGRVVVVPERALDAVTGLSGSGPAFVFMMIEAMADAGVREGLTRAEAQTMAAQTVYGSAKMVLETGKHPGALKDMVTSPMGTTIEGVAVLEKAGFRSAVLEAVTAAAEKSKQL